MTVRAEVAEVGPRLGPPGPDASRVHDAAGDRERARSLEARCAFLAEASRCLADSLDYDVTLATVAGLALPHLGAWCIVDVIEDGAGDPIGAPLDGAPAAEPDGHTVRRLAILHPDPARQALARELFERYPPARDDLVGAPRVMRTGQAEIVLAAAGGGLEPTARDVEQLRLLRALDVRAYLIAPMVARGRTVGAITFITAAPERAFDAADLLLAEDLARRCAMAVDNARLYRSALRARAEASAATARAEAATHQAQEARATADAANQAKADFMAVMSHELRTPLNAIGGYAELLELGVRGAMTPQQVEDLRRIKRAQRHLTGLIEQVLSYARIEAGRIRCELAEVDVYEAVLTAEVLVGPQARLKGVTVDWRACARGLVVRADRAWLHQILANLLGNAVKFTEGGGRLTLECEARAGRVDIRVRDTGIGIPADKLELIFEPFVQVGRRLHDAQPYEGVGLGLAISRDLARRMDGDLRVESREGEGSTFTLTMPSDAAPAGVA